MMLCDEQSWIVVLCDHLYNCCCETSRLHLQTSSQTLLKLSLSKGYHQTDAPSSNPNAEERKKAFSAIHSFIHCNQSQHIVYNHQSTPPKMSSTSTNLKHPNIAITTNPSHDLSIVEVPIPSPAAGECLIHVTATGICGSDVHFWKHGGIGSSKITCELGLGHESAGEIVQLGEGVEAWKIGMS